MIIFDPKSAYKHFDEDRLDEDGIRKAMAHPEWIALIDPADPTIPPGTSGNMVALVICLRPSRRVGRRPDRSAGSAAGT